VAICRLFALHAGTEDVEATFWLLDAPASLAEQSHANPDGFGLATLSSAGEFELVKRPALAAADDAFAHQARSVRAAQFLAHVRYADTGEVSLANTHPFVADGRAFAHNGVVGDLDEIDRQLGDNRDLVVGQTDSERLFALLTVAIREADGDVRRGISDAVATLAARYELYAINFLLGTPGELWAFRYPEHNQLFFLERGAGGPRGRRPLDEASGFGTIRMRSAAGAEQPLVVVASEPMDEDPGWTELGVGELLHIGADLQIDRETILDGPPAKQMVLSGLAVESQAQEHA
jgi:predicted glutamine amidotransferase